MSVKIGELKALEYDERLLKLEDFLKVKISEALSEAEEEFPLSPSGTVLQEIGEIVREAYQELKSKGGV